MPRKTVSVEWLKEKTNKFLADSDEPMKEQRLGIAFLFETVLFETQNYKGFSYLPSEWDSNQQALRDGYDESRRRYY